MLGCYDFCGHYEWTFSWLERAGGRELLVEYWRDAIAEDSQQHAGKAIREDGFAGMLRYWGHTLNEESPDQGFSITPGEDVVRMDIDDCPSKGFLLRNGLEQHPDYCDHCIGWIRPMLQSTGFDVAHQHNHLGQCWWEIRRQDDPTSPSEAGDLATKTDVRLSSAWSGAAVKIDTFQRQEPVDDTNPA